MHIYVCKTKLNSRTLKKYNHVWYLPCLFLIPNLLISFTTSATKITVKTFNESRKLFHTQEWFMCVWNHSTKHTRLSQIVQSTALCFRSLKNIFTHKKDSIMKLKGERKRTTYYKLGNEKSQLRSVLLGVKIIMMYLDDSQELKKTLCGL